METLPAAPWCKQLKVVSILGTLLLVAVGWLSRGSVPQGLLGGIPRLITALLPFAIGAGAALWIVSGYQVAPGVLLVRRLLWTTSIPLDGLSMVWLDPEVTKGSIKVFGNGGLFAFTGVYQSPKLGRYRAFVTDPRYGVVLARSRGIVVVTPADPESFVRQVKAFFPGIQVGAPARDA
jgi:hypothetical protein